LDPTWKIEQGFLEGCLGDAGAMKLEELFLGILPTKDKALSLSGAAQQIAVLNESAPARFAEKGAQGNLKAAEKLILDLAAGRPSRIAANASSFLVKVWNRLCWFCSLSLKHKSGKEVTLMGMEATNHKWQEIKRMDTSTIKLKHLELLVTFLFLLPDEDQKKCTLSMRRSTGRRASTAAATHRPRSSRTKLSLLARARGPRRRGSPRASPRQLKCSSGREF
jgi:hypothetical protein